MPLGMRAEVLGGSRSCIGRCHIHPGITQSKWHRNRREQLAKEVWWWDRAIFREGQFVRKYRKALQVRPCYHWLGSEALGVNGKCYLGEGSTPICSYRDWCQHCVGRTKMRTQQHYSLGQGEPLHPDRGQGEPLPAWGAALSLWAAGCMSDSIPLVFLTSVIRLILQNSSLPTCEMGGVCYDFVS